MENSYLPHNYDFNALPANLKRKNQPLSKIYTYPPSKNAVYTKPFPDIQIEDQQKYFYKYEYLSEIERSLNLIYQSLYQEQLEAMINDEIKMNEMKAEDLKLQQLNNYFKNSLFTSVMENVRNNYLKSQAEILAKNNTSLLDVKEQIADIRNADVQALTLQTQNAEIQTEIEVIENRIQDYLLKKIDDDDDDDEELRRMSQLLSEATTAPKPRGVFEERDEERENETFVETGNLQETELKELVNKIGEISKGEVEGYGEEQKELQEILEKKKEADKLLEQTIKKDDERIAKIQDYKRQFNEIKKLNNAFTDRISNILRDTNTFNKRSNNLYTNKTDINKNIDLAFKLNLLSEEEVDTIKNNMPSFTGIPKTQKETIYKNLNDIFKLLNSGYKVDIGNFMEGINDVGIAQGLNLEPVEKTYNIDILRGLQKDFEDYRKESITGLGLKTGKALVDKGVELRTKAEQILNTDLNTLLLPNIPNPEGQLWEDLPPVSEASVFEEEGGAFYQKPNPKETIETLQKEGQEIETRETDPPIQAEIREIEPPIQAEINWMSYEDAQEGPASIREIEEGFIPQHLEVEGRQIITHGLGEEMEDETEEFPLGADMIDALRTAIQAYQTNWDEQHSFWDSIYLDDVLDDLRFPAIVDFVNSISRGRSWVNYDAVEFYNRFMDALHYSVMELANDDEGELGDITLRHIFDIYRQRTRLRVPTGDDIRDDRARRNTLRRRTLRNPPVVITSPGEDPEERVYLGVRPQRRTRGRR